MSLAFTQGGFFTKTQQPHTLEPPCKTRARAQEERQNEVTGERQEPREGRLPHYLEILHGALTTPGPENIFIFAILGFELRTLRLLSRRSTTSPQTFLKNKH
jgi:hypothetical protein